MAKKVINSNQKPFSFLNDLLYPACAVFTVIIFFTVSLMHLAGLNVTETRDKYISSFDSVTNESTSSWKIGELEPIPPMLIIGIFIFCFTLGAMSYLRHMEFSKLTTRVLHFSGTLLSFFLFVLALSGYTANPYASLGSIMLALVLVGIAYFICLAIKMLLRRPTAFLSNKFSAPISRFIAPAIAVFAFLLLICTVLGIYITTDIKVGYLEEFDPNNGHKMYESWETVITPLAPTLQNYLRYLGTAALLALCLFVLKSKLHTVAKAFINLAISSCGFFLLWFIQMDYFHELDGMRLTSVIVFYAAYAVIATAIAVALFVLRRKREKAEAYTEQFSAK